MPIIDANGTPLYYVSQGSGPPLLMIHGTGGGADSFAPVAQALAKSHTVVTYDRRGFSRSTGTPHPPRGYLAAHAADAAALLKALDLGPAKIFGWSAGGLVALALAVNQPQAATSVVLYEPPYLVKTHAPLGFTIAFAQIMALRTLGAKRAAARKFYRTVFARRDGGNDFDAVPEALRTALLENAAPLLAELDGGTGEDLAPEKLAALPQPISLLTGAQSAPIFEAAAVRTQKALKIRRHIASQTAGHMMQLTDPAGFEAAVSSLLRDT